MKKLDPAQLWELGLGRVRVLSPIGRDLASDRWINGEYGPDSEFAKSAPKACAYVRILSANRRFTSKRIWRLRQWCLAR